MDKKITEDWVKCELYRQLVNKGYDVFPEVTYHNNNVRLRADLSVYYDDTFLCLVEVKNRKRSLKINKGKQFKKYKDLGFRFMYCLNKDQIKACVLKIETIAALKDHL